MKSIIKLIILLFSINSFSQNYDSNHKKHLLTEYENLKKENADLKALGKAYRDIKNNKFDIFLIIINNNNKKSSLSEVLGFFNFDNKFNDPKMKQEVSHVLESMINNIFTFRKNIIDFIFFLDLKINKSSGTYNVLTTDSEIDKLASFHAQFYDYIGYHKRDDPLLLSLIGFGDCSEYVDTRNTKYEFIFKNTYSICMYIKELILNHDKKDVGDIVSQKLVQNFRDSEKLISNEPLEKEILTTVARRTLALTGIFYNKDFSIEHYKNLSDEIYNTMKGH